MTRRGQRRRPPGRRRRCRAEGKLRGRGGAAAAHHRRCALCIGRNSEAAGQAGAVGASVAALMMMAPLTPAFFWMIGEEDRPRASFPCAHAQRGRVS